MERYYSIREFRHLLGVTAQTLRNWDRCGKLKPHHTSSNGYRYYSHEQLQQMTRQKLQKEKPTIGYCRVSSKKQQDDLQRQHEIIQTYLASQGRPFIIIDDIGSGINYNKQGLLELIRMIDDNEAGKIVVLHKDRLLRFGFELIEHMAKLHNIEIEIIDASPKTEEQELVEDLVQIITVFSCRLQGQRAHQVKRFLKEMKNYE